MVPLIELRGAVPIGIGLGLPLCQTIARAHGGTLAVRDVEPRGVAFAFALPLEEVLADE